MCAGRTRDPRPDKGARDACPSLAKMLAGALQQNPYQYSPNRSNRMLQEGASGSRNVGWDPWPDGNEDGDDEQVRGLRGKIRAGYTKGYPKCTRASEGPHS